MSYRKQLETKEIIKLGFFKIRSDKCELPDGRIMPNYYVSNRINYSLIM